MIIKLSLWVICTANLLALVSGSECPTGCRCGGNKVDCSYVSLKKFPDKMPSNVTILNMAGCDLKELDRSALETFDTVQQMHLEANNLTKINSEIFKMMKSLRRLDISNNKISEVHKRAFTGLSELVGLILMGNEIEKINGALSRTQGLTFLNVANNKLTEITEDEFAKLTKLKFLDLGSNQITKIHPNAFEKLKDLRYLILQNNKITSLGVLSFSSKMLSVVDFTKNALVRMPRGMPKSVSDLRAGHNKIASIEEDDISNITRLQLLTLNVNSIAKIHDDAFKGAKNLKEIWLTSNNLTSLPKTWPDGLVKLFVDSNKIKKIEKDAFNRNLEYITLERNELTEISVKSLSRLKNLTYLNLQGNNLTKLSKDVYVGMNSLQVLTLANNPIANIESKALGDLDALTKLDMSYNELNDVKLHMNIFKVMPRLKEINLMNCPGMAKSLLDKIREPKVSPIPSVQRIDLRYNNLFNLPTEMPTVFPNLTILELSSNAWHCDSKLVWMKKWLESAKIRFYKNDEERLACCTPIKLKGKPITDVPDKDFLSTPTDEDIPEKDEGEKGDDNGGKGKESKNDLAEGERANELAVKNLIKTSLSLTGVELKNQEGDEGSEKKSRKKRRKSDRKKSREERKKRRLSRKKRRRRRHKEE